MTHPPSGPSTPPPPSGPKTPARQDPAEATPQSFPTVATTGGPDRAGGPPAPGADTFSLPRPPEFSIGIGPLYDALPR